MVATLLRAASGVAAGAAFGWAARRGRLLSASGAVVGGALGATLVGLGAPWCVPGLAFFGSSSLLSRAGKARKREAAALSEKGSVRDAGQVLANGGVAWALASVYAVHPREQWYAGFLGAWAAAAADTWATEVGTLAAGRPMSLRTGRKVPRGTSGAVSLQGTLAALCGSATVAASAWAGAPGSAVERRSLFCVVTLSGWLGALADSVAGAFLQVQFRDPETGELTEREAGATGLPRRKVRGWDGWGNDAVNTLCTLSGAGLSVALWRALKP